MALNKSNTSGWVKALIIILIVAFVSLFMYQGFAGIFQLFQQSPSSSTASNSSQNPVTALKSQYQPQIDALTQAVQSDPTSYTAQVELANLHFDYAQKLSTPAGGASQITTEAMMAAYQEWTNAKNAYDAATKVAPKFDPPVQTDRSYATFYSNDTTGAIKIATEVTKKAPEFAQGWVHLGIYLEGTGDNKAAIAAYQKYLVLDPKGGNASFAQGRLKELGASAPATSTP